MSAERGASAERAARSERADFCGVVAKRAQQLVCVLTESRRRLRRQRLTDSKRTCDELEARLLGMIEHLHTAALEEVLVVESAREVEHRATRHRAAEPTQPLRGRVPGELCVEERRQFVTVLAA